KHRIKSSKESRLEFYIAYHRDLEFYQRNKKKVFCQYVFLRKKEKLDKDVYSSDYFINEAFNKEEISITNLKALPIIHITSLNLFEEKEERDHYYKVPRYIRVLDNSIWNLY